MSNDGSSKTGGRPLTADERRLWRTVTDTVRRQAPEHDAATFADLMRQHDLGNETPRPTARSAPRPAALPNGSSEQVSPAKSIAQPTPSAPALATFDAKRLRRLSRGAIEIGATLDLHGMRQHEAHNALRRFLAQAQARGVRHVSVITGKGGSKGRGYADTDVGEIDDYGRPRERGVLRRVVRHWLEDVEFRAFVVSYTTAPRSHGGEGALFVHIRRANKPR
ncbi:MAG: Smr/MutS family protein [Pseudomonadota bacterium]